MMVVFRSGPEGFPLSSPNLIDQQLLRIVREVFTTTRVPETLSRARLTHFAQCLRSATL
jgi:hypothetical protein